MYKMANGSIIGSIFSFLAIIFVFTTIFITYNQNLIEQVKSQKEFIKDLEIQKLSKLNLKNIFYSSGRFHFNLENPNYEDYLIIPVSKSETCFEFFLNKNYIRKSNIFFYNSNNLFSQYNYIEKKDKNFNLIVKSKFNNLSFIDCYSNLFLFSNNSFNEALNSYYFKKKFYINNSKNETLKEYQVLIDLNNSNFDFSKSKDYLSFYSFYSNFYSLDLTFDDFEQKLKDYSIKNLEVYLGNNISVETTDPKKVKGVFFNGLNFTGNNYVTVMPDESLVLDNYLTFSAWIKWNNKSLENIQNIYTFGNMNNSIGIINSGTDKGKIFFNLSIDGTLQSLISNIKVNDSWFFLTIVYDGNNMKIYINKKLVGIKSIEGLINGKYNKNYIGSKNISSNYFNGIIDEVKVLKYPLNISEIEKLYSDSLSFKSLDFYISNWDSTNNIGKVYVKIPVLLSNSSSLYYIYLSNKTINMSNIDNTFSYYSPRTVGYVVSDRISDNTGLTFLSLYNNNSLVIGNNKFNLNFLDSNTLSSSQINLNDKIKMKSLSQVEGNGNTVDIIVPISWAGTKFFYKGFRNSDDRFCMLSPWGTANVQILDSGVLEWNGSVDKNGICIAKDINNVLSLISDIPILVSYHGSSSYDAFVFYPATKNPLFGISSSSGYIASGFSTSLTIINTNGGSSNVNIDINNSASLSGSASGSGPGYKIIPNNFIGGIQQADHDGTESTVYVPQTEMGTMFGSSLGNEYIVLVSPYSNANCSVYDSNNTLVDNIVNGVGIDQVYKYGFDTGNDNTYISNKWYVKCKKPVWGYFEEDIYGDETNFLTQIQMRQYTYPEPKVIFN